MVDGLRTDTHEKQKKRMYEKHESDRKKELRLVLKSARSVR